MNKGKVNFFTSVTLDLGVEIAVLTLEGHETPPKKWLIGLSVNI